MTFDEIIEVLMLVGIAVLGLLAFVQVIDALRFVIGSIGIAAIGVASWKLGED